MSVLLNVAMDFNDRVRHFQSWIPSQGIKNVGTGMRSLFRSVRHPLRSVNLLIAILLTTVLLVGVGSLAWWLIGFALVGEPTYLLAKGSETRGDATRIALTMVAGFGGAVALVVTYRKQSRAEDGSFLERLSTAAGLLGDTNPTVQVSGIYALAALADERTGSQRQQCIDVLCGYMRLPYFPTDKIKPHPTTTATRTIHTFVDRSLEVQTTTNHRPSDGEIRRTIIDVIRQHLQPGSPKTWSKNNFNFQGAVFDGGSFWGAEFSGGLLDFTGAKFSGGTLDFTRAKFSGGDLNFRNAEFSGGTLDFWGAEFSGGDLAFTGAKFSGGDLNFRNAEFSGGTLDFWDAMFSGGDLNFTGAKFSGGDLAFWGAEFSGGTLDFRGAKFSGGTLNFRGDMFSGGTLNFTSAMFSGGLLDFRGAMFSGGLLDFSSAMFSGGLLDFTGAEFSGGDLNFRFPSDWGHPPLVDWTSNPPEGVLPKELPFIWSH